MQKINLNSRSIIEFLSALPDTRRKAGRRHSQEHILLIVLMAIMSGYHVYRGIGDFIERNKADLIKYLKPSKGRLPTFYTIRRVLIGLDFEAFSKAFYEWSKQYICISEGEWLSIDGKALGGTVESLSDEYQNFVNLVSVFVSTQKMVLANAKVINSKQSEIPVVRQLIQSLDLEGNVFTIDALHCQKKQWMKL